MSGQLLWLLEIRTKEKKVTYKSPALKKSTGLFLLVRTDSVVQVFVDILLQDIRGLFRTETA